MMSHMKLITILALSLFCAACGGDLEIYEPKNNEDEASSGSDAGQNNLNNVNNANNANNIDRDMGSEDPDMTADMPSQPDMGDPTTNAPQSGPTVAAQITGSCSTISVKGLSEQLMDQMNCEIPGVMKSFANAPSVTYDTVVFPFLQAAATDSLVSIAANTAGTINLNSATRTLAQQYLLWSWYYNVPRLCNANLAASPGNSNHNGGLAIDIDGSNTWKSPLNNNGWVDNVGGEPWHFYFTGGGTMDVRSLSVLSFQKLYNRNFPENTIDEDGLYGPQTEGALRESPANGFTRAPNCPAVNALVHYPFSVPLDVDWRTLADGVVQTRVISSTGIRGLRYEHNGEVLATSEREGNPSFGVVLELPETDEEMVAVDIVGLDQYGDERARETAFINTKIGGPFARPLGGGGYEAGIDGESSDVSVTLETDDAINISPTPRGGAFRIDASGMTISIDGPASEFEFRLNP